MEDKKAKMFMMLLFDPDPECAKLVRKRLGGLTGSGLSLGGPGEGKKANGFLFVNGGGGRAMRMAMVSPRDLIHLSLCWAIRRTHCNFDRTYKEKCCNYSAEAGFCICHVRSRECTQGFAETATATAQCTVLRSCMCIPTMWSDLCDS